MTGSVVLVAAAYACLRSRKAFAGGHLVEWLTALAGAKLSSSDRATHLTAQRRAPGTAAQSQGQSGSHRVLRHIFGDFEAPGRARSLAAPACQPAAPLLRKVSDAELMLVSTGAQDWLDSTGKPRASRAATA
jgi:hypothetical protein